MGFPSLIKARMLRRLRKSYNSGYFNKASRQAKLIQFLFRDRESLDILARSNLRIKNYEGALKCYRKASKLGYALLDHEENYFRASLGSEQYYEAFEALQKIRARPIKKTSTAKLKRKLRSLNDTERVTEIEKMGRFAPLPKEISDLLPWAPRKIELNLDSVGYSTLNRTKVESERYLREINRSQSSGAYRISKHITDSLRNPVRLISLPITTPILAIRILRNRLGSRADTNDRRYSIIEESSPRDCIVMFPTNGVGFGHFTRLLAISKQIKIHSPNTEIVFFTTMPTIHILSEFGIVCYHLPGRYRYEDMPANQWNALCEEMLCLIFSLHRPKAFIFDGAYPYRGMLNSIKNKQGNLLKIWLRRGAKKASANKIPAGSIGHFDAIIRPGDSVKDDLSEETKLNVPILKTKPILLAHDAKSETNIRNRLGIPKEATLCYIQLGAGKINDIDEDLQNCLNSLEDYPRAYAVIGESMLGERKSFENERTRVLRDYPNSKYFEDFDFAIIAGGYNSFHEVVNAQLPSICFPNLNTGMDDQYARAKVASDSGGMIVIKNRTERKISLAISRLMEHDVRAQMRQKLASLRIRNGAEEAAKWIISQIDPSGPAKK